MKIMQIMSHICHETKNGRTTDSENSKKVCVKVLVSKSGNI